MKLVFATNNNNKLKEVRQLMPAEIEILSLKDIGCDDELPETGRTLNENAFQKAQYVHEKYGWNCFSDDTGLEVQALGGRPGVISARYAGPACRASDNIQKLLTELKNEENRNARFRTVIACLIDSEVHYFEGQVDGLITETESGDKGFGYDPVFKPSSSEITFAEMTPEEKNQRSHRAESIRKFVDWLKLRKDLTETQN
ncbi:MAG: RdgB/HAM1 family non-canonical purine NTP pyrophosphatase [Bacteroidia bacterium]|nr:RdgB/HAM1 family non-canonical purine NTP pyrophosphatase [Bacteroidia bacterium]